MRRWFLMHRLLLAGLAIVFGWLAINAHVRQSIVDAVRSTTNADSRIGRVAARWRTHSVELSDVMIADPYQEGEPLIHAERVTLALDKAAFLRRKVVVHRGSVEGLQLGHTKGRIDVLAPARIAGYRQNLAERFHEVNGGWLADSAERVKSGLPGSFTASEKMTAVMNRWPEANQQIQTRATTLCDRALAIQKQLELSGENRLRNLSAYQSAIANIEELSREIDEVERHVGQLQQQMRMDCEAIRAAGQEDLKSVPEGGQLATLDSETLSNYLVGSEVAESLANVLHWVAWSRRFTPTFSAKPQRQKRGRDIHFGALPRKSDVLVESLVLQGSMDQGRGQVPMEGTVCNWSSNATCSQPTEITIQTGGETPLLVEAVLDRTTQACRDHIVIDSPRVMRASRMLGDMPELRVSVSPGTMRIRCNLDLVGERMTGQMHMTQSQVQLESISDVKVNSPEVTRALASTVGEIDSLDITVDIGGTITTPEWTVASNLGPRIAAGLRQSLEEQMIAKRTQQTQAGQQQAMAQLQATESQVVQQQTQVMNKLRESLAAIREVRDRIAVRTRMTDGLLNPGSPLRESYIR